MDKQKHKTFVSFYHHDDQSYKDYIDEYFSDVIINKSVMDGEYDSDDSDEYIKRLIREDKISDSSVVIVLIGKNTHHRKHVDWEIYAGLSASVNGNAGLLGILLPAVIALGEEDKARCVPPRLNDNVESGYAKLYTWDYAIKHFAQIVQRAFDDRKGLKNKMNNARKQMQRNGVSE